MKAADCISLKGTEFQIPMMFKERGKVGNKNWERNSWNSPHLAGDQPVWEPLPGAVWQNSLPITWKALARGCATAAPHGDFAVGFCKRCRDWTTPTTGSKVAYVWFGNMCEYGCLHLNGFDVEGIYSLDGKVTEPYFQARTCCKLQALQPHWFPALHPHFP